jgi:hypothetical protein
LQTAKKKTKKPPKKIKSNIKTMEEAMVVQKCSNKTIMEMKSKKNKSRKAKKERSKTIKSSMMKMAMRSLERLSKST